jgi:hypothetical protein
MPLQQRCEGVLVALLDKADEQVAVRKLRINVCHGKSADPTQRHELRIHSHRESSPPTGRSIG